MTPIEQLKAVLCDPEGKCCISGSDGDRQAIDEAIALLEAQPPTEAGEIQRASNQGFADGYVKAVDDVTTLGFESAMANANQIRHNISSAHTVARRALLTAKENT